MSVRLKPLSEQVILITGASSGIGLMTARRATEAGAKVILVARNEKALQDAVWQIEQAGGQAVHAVADVGDPDELRKAAEIGIERFGRIDTWVNNAGVSIYGKIEEVDPADDKRLFETNFWGVVNGSRLAVEHLKRGGAIINLGSVLSDVAIPLQGMYSASKHAVMGFTDALRMEIMDAGLPISVTLIKPSAMNTPYPRHARNYMANQPSLPPPVYTPELVADAFLDAAASPSRELYVGGGGRLMAALGRQIPMLMDWYLAKFMPAQQQSNRPASDRAGALHAFREGDDGSTHGDLGGERMVRNHSVYTTLVKHPLIATGVAVAVGAAVFGLLKHLGEEQTTTQKAKTYAQDTFARAAKAVKKMTTNGLHKNRWM